MATGLTLLLTAIAATIAFMQWFVARQKFVLDLFDRRFKAYNDVLYAVRPIISAGAVANNQLFELQLAIQNAKFLFGSDVNDYLEEIRRTTIRLQYWNAIYNTQNPQAPEAPQGMATCLMELNDFFTKYPKLCQAYMMMPEKRVRTPIEWFNDRNELRKSYGAEPPKIDT
ncbi:hypothetical protein ABCW43_13660 [Neorhizobium sp. IRAMC:178]|uniref:hypothetical protein n=1 Tax=Neorhizobium tunisiense TaxID=3144793 RepID=UPI0031F6EFD3